MVVTLLILLAVLQLLDGYTTTRILNSGGRELNPVMAKAFAKFGTQQTLIAKGVLVVLAGYIASLTTVWLLAGICAVYVVVIDHNWRQMK